MTKYSQYKAYELINKELANYKCNFIHHSTLASEFDKELEAQINEIITLMETVITSADTKKKALEL